VLRWRSLHYDAQPGGVDPRYTVCTLTERQFIDWGLTRDMQIQRQGWPDFLCQSTKGGFAGIEVKQSPDDPLRDSQVRCFRFLEQAGIPVYVWTPVTKRLTPWREHCPRRVVDDSSDSADNGERVRDGAVVGKRRP
jgi:hypothetical protein